MMKNINKAFTLIELLVIVAIVGVLSGFIFVSMTNAINSAKDAKRKADLSAIEQAILIYSANHENALPSAGTNCNICNGCSGACSNLYANLQPYLPTVPTDPDSGNFYKYNVPAANTYTLQSNLSNGDVYQYESSANTWMILSGIQETPTFSNGSGAIAFGTTVTIASVNADAIYYTTNGDTPTTSSTNQATTPLVVNSAVTVKALAVRSGYANSSIATVAYTQAIQTTPTFSPVAGAIASGTTVTIISNGADAIYYTTNGDTPTTSSTNQATTPLVINSPVTVKALAVRSGYANSAIGSAAYTLLIAQDTPTFSPIAGAIAAGTSVTITSANADAIYYTLDGNNPTTSSSQYTTPLTINPYSPVTVKALAVRSGYANSAIGSATYTQAATADLTNMVLSGSPTNYSFSGGTYNYNGVGVLNAISSITITPTGSGAITVDGSAVTSGTASNSIALTVGVEKTITIVATETGKTAKTYIIKVTRGDILGTQPTPTFSPAAGTIAVGATVTIVSANADAIYYTTNGDTPTTSSTNQAITPLVINSAVTVKALAVRANYNNSAVGSATYAVYASTCAAATNAQVQCTPITISSTEEACKCTYLSGAGTTTWTSNVSSAELLIVGGGGGGGEGSSPWAFGGSGGGGGVLNGTLTGLSGSYTVTVGAGGARGGYQSNGVNGGNSVFGSYTAYGGGRGGTGNVAGGAGGSGGGGSGATYGGATQTTQGTLTGYGNRGGTSSARWLAGGGGGPAAVGGADNGYSASGKDFSTTGSVVTYARGSYTCGGAGTNDIGNGGGGGDYGGNCYAGNGGNGVVIFRYTHP